MSDRFHMTEDDARGLDELAATDLRMAKGFAERALAEDDPDTANGLARSYQRAARSYRQSLALKMRLRRELAREARDEGLEARNETRRQVAAVRAKVQAAVKALIWTEYEADEREDLETELDELLDDDEVEDDFVTTPIARHVARLAGELELTPLRSSRAAEEPTRDPGATAQPEPLGPGSPLRCDRDDVEREWAGSG